MIVFDLQCGVGHSFEGWFGSSSDFDSQQSRGLIECPNCASKSVTKKLSAPRINLGAAQVITDSPVTGGATGNRQSERNIERNAERISEVVSMQNAAPAELSASARETIERMQALWMEMAKQVVANTEDVGSNFAEEARKIHYKEAPERNIRGVATRDEGAALLDEGIEIHAFPLPESLKGTLQ